jgi:hypothetical protein
MSGRAPEQKTTGINNTGFRPLSIPVKRLNKIYGVFWWLAGIAMALLFLLFVLFSYQQSKIKAGSYLKKEMR